MQVDVRALHGWALVARAIDPGAPAGGKATWRFERVGRYLYLLGAAGNVIQRVETIRHNVDHGLLHAGAQVVTVGPVAPCTHNGRQLPIREWTWQIESLDGIPEVVLTNRQIELVFVGDLV